HRSYSTLSIRAPRRAIESSFVSGAWSGTTTVQGTPSSRAIQATPWPMFPAVAVTTPACSLSSGIWSTALLAPRSLNEPIGCRFSSFRWISRSPSCRSRTSGVRRTRPARRSRAAEERRLGHRLVVELARGRDRRADRVHVRSGREPRALEHRLVRRGRGHDHVGAVDRRLGTFRYLDLEPDLCRDLPRVVGR